MKVLFLVLLLTGVQAAFSMQESSKTALEDSGRLLDESQDQSKKVINVTEDKKAKKKQLCQM